MTAKKTTLLFAVASSAEAAQIHTLEVDFEIHFVYTLQQACTCLLSHTVDLMVCAVQFDESQMGQFLHHCKGDPRLGKVPFLCVRMAKGALPESFYRRTKTFVEGMGGFFLDYQSVAAEAGGHAANAALLETVNSLLTGSPAH